MIREVVFNPIDGLPKPITPRRGRAAEFKLMRLRECPPDEGIGDNPERIDTYWRANISTAQWYNYDCECFCTIYLSTRRRIVGFNLVSLGTMDTILCHPREVFRTAIVAGAAAIVIAHNHPSGDPSPSEADIKVTRDLIRAGQLLRIEVLDHVIIGQPGEGRIKAYSSLREMGYFFM